MNHAEKVKAICFRHGAESRYPVCVKRLSPLKGDESEVLMVLNDEHTSVYDSLVLPRKITKIPQINLGTLKKCLYSVISIGDKPCIQSLRLFLSRFFREDECI